MTWQYSSRKTVSALLLILALVVSPAVMADASSTQRVTINHTTFVLGSSQAQTLGESRRDLNVVPADTNGQYFLYPKAAPLGTDQSAGQRKALGSITFANDRLIRVTRNLGSFRSADGQNAIENLIDAFARAPNKGEQPSVHTDKSVSGDTSTTRVYFSYSDRVIQVLVFHPAYQSDLATVDISEQYASPNTGPSGRSS